MAKVLLGFMGVGKSSVAPYLNGRFVDMDQVIAVSYTHLTLPTIRLV